MRPLFIIAALVLFVAPAGAQTTETPVAFDSAARILSVNPSLATRLALVKPAWPVTGPFAEARLYQVSTGGYSLAVTRSTGAIDRYHLDDVQMAALRQAFVEAVVRNGGIVSEDATSVISEQAKAPFIRDQMALSAIVYGPSLAALSDDGPMGAGVYMMSIGGTFFGLNEFARTRSITKSQNSLTTDGALRGWATTGLASHALGLELSEKGTALAALVGGIGGSAIGFNRGARLTNSEAHAAMTGSTLAAGAVLGAATAVGVIGEEYDRMASAALLTGGIAGYIAGPAYPRRAKYTVTAGDISIVRLGAMLGAAAAITPFVEFDDMDSKLAAGILTTGWVGGALITDRIAAKRFNHSNGDSRMIYLGALGGGLMGLALPVMTQSDNGVFIMSSVTAGAILGTFATQSMMDPAREGGILRSLGSSANSAKVEFKPESALLAATKQRGNHTLLLIRL